MTDYTGANSVDKAWIPLDMMFRTAVDHPIRTQWLTDADIAYKFEQGDQWTTSERADLTVRGQPAIVENEIRPSKERLIGKFRKQRTNVTYHGRNVGADEEKAKAYSDLHRHTDYVNGYEFTEAKVANDMLIGGVGWLEACVKENELGQPQVRYRWEDPFAVFYDPFSRAYDINEDARFLCRSKWLYEDEAINIWPKKAAQIKASIGTSQPSASALSLQDPDVLANRNWWSLYFDQTHKRFRPVEIWYKKRATEQVLQMGDGTMVSVRGESPAAIRAAKKDLGAVVSSRSIDQLWVAVFCGDVMLDGPKAYPYGNLYPLIPFWAYRKADGQPQGWVWQLIDPQREINARRSKAIWALNNRQTIYERNTIANKAELASEMAAMDGQIEIEPGKFDRFLIRENQDISQGNLSMLQESKAAIRRMSGEDQVNPAPEVRSGAGLKRLEQSQENGVMTLFDHIRQSRRIKAILTHDLVKEFYTEEMTFQITDDPDVHRIVSLNSDHFDSLRNTIYDLVVTDTFDFSTSHQEQFTELLTALPQILQHGSGWAGLLIKMSDLRNKEGLLKAIEQMSQQPAPTPKVSVSLIWHDLPAEQQLAWAQKWQMLELVKAIQSKPSPPAFAVKEIASLEKTKIKAKTDIDKAMLAHDSKRHATEAGMQEQEREHVKEVVMTSMEQANEQGTEDTAQADSE